VFPESKDPLVQAKPNTAISFSGGGARAYLCALGVLGGLTELDLMKNVRYIGGISGGSWASMTYVYSQLSVNDTTLLGRIIPPEEITYDNLNVMDPSCARGFAQDNFLEHLLGAWLTQAAGPADAWVYATHLTYTSKANIPFRKPFSWSASNVADIVARNPMLKSADFALPTNSGRPFPVIGASLLGPSNNSPFDSTDNTTMLEFTPLYVGQMTTQDVFHAHKGKGQFQRQGGLIETFAFGGAAPIATLPSGQNEAVFSLPVPTSAKMNSNQGVWSVADAAGASSWAPGMTTSTIPLVPSELGLHANYWSPTTSSSAPQTTDSLLGDGGCLEDVNLISFLQRGVTNIVLFGDFVTPLSPLELWNPYTDPLLLNSMEMAIPSFFGRIPEDITPELEREFSIYKNQVFASADFPAVALALQQAQARGNGAIASTSLITIANPFRGVPAGLKVNITWVLLSRAPNWEAQLNPQMQNFVVPVSGGLNTTVSSGEFKSFPHYPTVAGDINFRKGNLLSNLMGWVVKQNAALFKRVLL